MNVTESLLRMTELTEQNLELLRTINESFHARRAHLSTEVAGERFTIPSFIALENKVNHLQSAFDNLVHSAADGAAWMNFNGDSKFLQLAGYEQTPNPIKPIPSTEFGIEETNYFRDMLTPKPFIKFDLSSTGNNITEVEVLKMPIYNTDVAKQIKANSNVLSYAEFMKILNDNKCNEGEDYKKYTVRYEVPLRKHLGAGEYIIESIDDDKINDLENYIVVTLREGCELKYTTADGVTEADLTEGCILMSYDGSCQLEIVRLSATTRRLKLKALHGNYTHFIGSGETGEVSDYSKLKFYRPNAEIIDEDRILKVALEEDQYVFISAAPINSNINTISVWGEGVLIDTADLRTADGVPFNDYYNKNVKNIGDTLNEMCQLAFPAITRISKSDFQELLKYQPVLKYGEHLKVVHINKHLNQAEAAKNIRALYSQKQRLSIDLEEVQNKISTLTADLSAVSYDDTSGVRGTYEAQISDLNKRKNELITSVSNIMASISLAANDLTAPVSDNKYRVRGFWDPETTKGALQFLDDVLENVIGIEVRYRYRNPDTPDTNVSVINNFVFTEWNSNNPPLRQRVMGYDRDKYKVEYTDITGDGYNKTANEIKFNQIDVPISQGEVVDIEIRLIWGFGYPFVKNTSAWSETLTVSFPDEYIEDVQIKTIIEENNNDIETNRFDNILREQGVTAHIEDGINDQDIKYFHKPENISSGFYTQERRIIPLRDKLQDLENRTIELMDLIQGSASEDLTVSVIIDNTTYIIEESINNEIYLMPYSEIPPGESRGAYSKRNTGEDEPVTVTAVVKITNNSNHIVNLFSLFPGPYDTRLKCDSTGKPLAGKPEFISKYIWDEMEKYRYNRVGIIPEKSNDLVLRTIEEISILQTYAQWVYFRNTNPFTGERFGYSTWDLTNAGDRTKYDNVVAGMMTYMTNPRSKWKTTPKDTLCVLPTIVNKHQLSLRISEASGKKVLHPKESVSFPLAALYKLSSTNDSTTKDANKLRFTVQFNIRPSVYKDPLYYEVTFISTYDKLIENTLNSHRAQLDTLVNYNISM